MNSEEALAWLRGERSHTNVIYSVMEPNERGRAIVMVEQADAATVERAYWVTRARREGLIE